MYKRKLFQKRISWVIWWYIYFSNKSLFLVKKLPGVTENVSEVEESVIAQQRIFVKLFVKKMQFIVFLSQKYSETSL